MPGKLDLPDNQSLLHVDNQSADLTSPLKEPFVLE
jgi:hypothetical protein